MSSPMLAATIARIASHRAPRQVQVQRIVVRPPTQPLAAHRPKVTVHALQQMLATKARIAVLTAYDYPTAARADRAGTDITLVGDSLAQVALGFPSTTRLSLDMMVHHCAAAARGTAHAFLLADLPFGSHPTPADGVRAAVRLVQEGGVDAVKLEGGAEIVPVIEALVSNGIPVCGHIGLLPTRAAETGFRVQGRSAEGAMRVLRDAEAISRAGAFAMVVEAIPHRVAKLLTAQANERGTITIGIGAGPECNGQVLVGADALGEWRGHQAKFVRRFAQVGDIADDGARAYVDAVRDGSFPDAKKEGYEMQECEWERLKTLLAEQSPNVV
ncbi:putative ketopantoate hydroxymethyltransferase [Exidia glandulosa HHB12029]|uniref:3-methyl-2-oxobutanoate hydroxymethyltransferase n=1 Tax=Exidia glandulosa HHB12029 TaxID=1314781 RepID=A0A165L909_EXIGL|nr:putative ketopantoate hydroxymethyltransferase [Exidia glandulosa HHB12029]